MMILLCFLHFRSPAPVLTLSFIVDAIFYRVEKSKKNMSASLEEKTERPSQEEDDEEEEEDLFNKRIQNSGCSKQHYQLQV